MISRRGFFSFIGKGALALPLITAKGLVARPKPLQIQRVNDGIILTKEFFNELIDRMNRLEQDR